MLKFTKLLAVTLLGLFVLSNSVLASAVSGISECKMEAEIESQENGEAIAVLTNVKSSNFFPNPYCDEFKDEKIKIIASNSRAQMLMREPIQELSLGIERGSSMGENGAVMFVHWHIKNLKIGGVLVDPLEFLLFDINLLEGHEVSYKAEDSTQCHHVEEKSEELYIDKVGVRMNTN